jgi:hypothetical protein
VEERVDALTVLARRVVDVENVAVLYAHLRSAEEVAACAKGFGLDQGAVAAGAGAAAAESAAGGSGPPKKRKKKKRKDDAATGEAGAAAADADKAAAAADTAAGSAAAGAAAAGAAAADGGAVDVDVDIDGADDADAIVADDATRVCIFVTDPEKVKGGIGGHMEYSVAARTNNEAYAKKQGTPVKRRYRHFVWLHDSLTFYLGRGALIPSLPEAKVTGRFDPEFVEQRRRDLERYLNRVGSHPVLCTSPALLQFLQASDDEWDAALKAGKAELKADIKADKKDKGAKDVKKKLAHSKEMRALDNGFERFTAQLEYVTSAADKFEDVKKHLKVKGKAESDLAVMTEELGWLCLKAGVNESENGGSAVLGEALQTFARALATGTAKLRKLAVDVERVELLDAVREYMRLFDGARALLTSRHQALYEYTVAAEATNAAEGKLAKAREEFSKKANDKTQKKAAAAETALEEAKVTEEKRRLEFVNITAECFREMRRFHAEMRHDWRDILAAYVKGQAEVCGKQLRIFEDLVPEIERLPARESEWEDAM